MHEVGSVENPAISQVVVDEKGELWRYAALISGSRIAGVGGVGVGCAYAAQHADGPQVQGVADGDVAAAGGGGDVDDVTAAADGGDFAFADAVVN